MSTRVDIACAILTYAGPSPSIVRRSSAARVGMLASQRPSFQSARMETPKAVSLDTTAVLRSSTCSGYLEK